jgi:hypothetical protein
MVHILEGVPTFSQSLGKTLGGGLGSGISKGLEFAQKMGVKRQQDLQKNKAKLLPGIKTHLSLYDKNKEFDSEMIGRLHEKADQYVDAGLPYHEAINEAFQEMKQGAGQGASGQMDTSGNNLQSDVAENNARSAKRNVFQQMGVVGEPRPPSKGFLSNEKGEFSAEEFAKNIKRVPYMFGRAATGLADLPFQLAKDGGVSPRGKLPEDFKTLTDYYDEATGGQGVPKNAIERIASGGILGVPGIVAAIVEEQLHNADLPKWAQTSAGIASFILTHKARNSKYGAIAQEAEKVAAETGKTSEQVIEAAAKEAKTEVADALQSGEPSGRSLKDKITEAPKISEKVKETPKHVFSKRAAQLERKKFGEKLAESPLDEYYSIKAKEAEKQASKRPETLEREREIRTSLAPEEKKLFEDIRHKRDDLARMDKARKKLLGQERARVDTLYQYRVKSIEEATDKLKDVQYQMKYGRTRPSEAEINAQIDDSVKRFKESIENPTPENIKQLERQLDLDKKYIERAEKLSKRGELAGEIRPDTFLRMKSKYLEGYRAAVKEAKESINTWKQADDPMALSAIAKEKKLIDTLNSRIKRLEADIVNQTDNIKAMRALEKPSGAFYKQQLKNLKKDEALFKSDLFRHNKLKSPEDLKITKTYKENAPEVKLGKETAENPNAENLKKASEQTGKSEEVIKEELKKDGKEFKEEAKKINEGTVDPKTESNFIRRTKRFVKLFGSGFALGALHATLEEALEMKINSKVLKFLGYIVGGISVFGSFGGAYTGYKAVQSLFDNIQAEKLKSMRGTPGWNRYTNNMRKSNGEAKAKRVIKIANEP